MNTEQVKKAKEKLKNKGYTDGELFRMTGWEIVILSK